MDGKATSHEDHSSLGKEVTVAAPYSNWDEVTVGNGHVAHSYDSVLEVPVDSTGTV